MDGPLQMAKTARVTTGPAMVREPLKSAIQIHTVVAIARGIHRTEVAVVAKTTWSGQVATGTFIALRPIKSAPVVLDCSTVSHNRLT